ncbi:MAG TPA: CDP-alcohol phosphatidyltransferase family protein, partial [Acidimicrobiales bacterium]|nr:CDP-alcohol phosphatidyltransferase family protein [Acidimicrobiales bacterium]
ARSRGLPQRRRRGRHRLLRGQEALVGVDGSGDVGQAPGEDRILTVPNVISLVRLACIPIFVWLVFGADEWYSAAWLLGALGATDWIDGFIARRWNQVSTLGKVLDPTADRLLLGVGMVTILITGSVPLWVGLAAVIRELAVSIAAVVLAALGARRIDVQWVGKAGTFAMMFAVPFFLASGVEELWWGDQARFLAWLFAIPGLALGWYAAAAYVPLARRALQEGRVG